MPEKSGTDAALFLAPAAGVTAGATGCATTGAAAAIANAANTRQSRALMVSSPGVPFLIRAAPGIYTRHLHGREQSPVQFSRRRCLGSRMSLAHAGYP